MKANEGSTTTVKGSEATSQAGSSSGTTKEAENTSSAGSDTTHETTPIFSTEGTTTSNTLPEPPVKIQPPIAEYPNYYPTTKPPRRNLERVSSETSEIVALIIGVVAGILIAVILVILIVLRFKSHGERSYKVDDGKGFQPGPNAALLGTTSSNNGQAQYQVNGALRNGDKNQIQKSKKRDSKDIKEWYV